MTETLTDQPGQLRDEDSFDTAAVHEWLSSHVDGLVGLPEVRQFPGGASNLTYLLRYPDRELILRRPPVGRKAASAHDMKREYRVQRQLRPVYPYVPNVLALCENHDLIGSDFYVMERIPGIILRRELPPGMTMSPERARTLGFSFIDRLIELHQVDADAAGLGDLGKGAGYVERQVRGWSERFRAARTENVPDFEDVMAWVAAHMPDDVRICVIHNDFRFDNAVLDGPETLNVVGVLDWEMATLGDALMDLAAVTTYWIQGDDDEAALRARKQITHLPGMPTRREVVSYYCERTGLEPGDWTFYEVFGLFRLAVILQQIYYRYHHGQTHNPAFKDLWMSSAYFEWRCRQAMER
ncbi:MAG TPA: phosphotransferase family protein [Actinophytocola sp.]|uniref:phosphotransferase family protein n=1 Tax=Actinophytocola sp. TaxID=1872138 RepID=UPI002DB83DF9|nr:phosphotransferase family protein [Actinophytocola sp.]HEU5472513.1 phosphotransferase family protein [Actinophytocola sp.]